MVEISTSILSVIKGEESKTFFRLEKAKTDYFHIDVMDGKFVEKNTYQRMLDYSSYVKRISNLPLDVHLMVKNIEEAIEDFLSYEPNIITFHYEACEDKEEVMKYINKIKEERNAIEEKVNTGLAQQEYYNKLAKELENLNKDILEAYYAHNLIELTIYEENQIKKYTSTIIKINPNSTLKLKNNKTICFEQILHIKNI